MPVKDADRAEFETFSDLGFDNQGREVLVGLTYEETEWYLDVLERDRVGSGLVSREETVRRSMLNERHLEARLKIVEETAAARFNALWDDHRLNKPARIRRMQPGGAVGLTKFDGPLSNLCAGSYEVYVRT